jgi:WD40 repeat protein
MNDDESTATRLFLHRVTHICNDKRTTTNNNNNNNFVKSVHFSPDGTQLLTTNEDRSARLYRCGNGGRLEMRLKYNLGESIYDAAWFPSTHEAARCFVTTSRDHPLQLWDADTHMLRASYVALDNVYEPEAALSCAFSPGGERLFAGFENRVRVFDVASPTELPREVCTYHRKTRPVGVHGLLSCFAVRENDYAVGSYSGAIGLFDERCDDSGATALLYSGHVGGITQLRFTPNGYYLLSGARKDDHVVCWDLRTNAPFCRFERQCRTNQRLQFDLSASGGLLLTPSGNNLDVYDLLNGDFVSPKPTISHRFEAAVNSVSLHPSRPVVAIGTGERKSSPPDAEANRVHIMTFVEGGDGERI